MPAMTAREEGPRSAFSTAFRGTAFVLLSLTLLASPFPLGGAVSWGVPAIALLPACAWVAWALSLAQPATTLPSDVRLVRWPVLLLLAVLFWAWIQTYSLVPEAWVHPVWGWASTTLQRGLGGYISINPWRTLGALLTLATYGAAFWISFVLSRDVEKARSLLQVIVVITAFYAAYSFALMVLGTSQVTILYGVAPVLPLPSGPFMLHNTFATFCGLGTLAAASVIVDRNRDVVWHRGARQILLSMARVNFGPAALAWVAALFCFSALLASSSRAGFLATLVSLFALAVLALVAGWRSTARVWLAVMILIGTVLVGALTLGSDSLGARMAQLADTGQADDIRLALWDASLRMIRDAPWRGLGLGTFQDAYPLYGSRVLPHVMDRAHSDYLEFAAGAGLPAALAGILGIGWLAFLCARGALMRRRNRHFALLGIGASILVALHSTVDFSLQIPAVGILYAVILGLGVAQSSRTAP